MPNKVPKPYISHKINRSMYDTATFWSFSPEEALQRMDSESNGLSDAQAAMRRERSPRQSVSPFLQGLRLFLLQFKKPLTLLLLVGLAFSATLGEFTNAAIILAILLLSGLLGFVQERKADKAMEQLLRLIQARATVRRNGIERSIPLDEVVPGDILLLKAGDIIPADSLLLELEDLYVNEAALSGESFPSEKKQGVLPPDTPLIRRTNAIFAGSNVISGTAVALAMATGTQSQLGILEQGLNAAPRETAFERGLRTFGYLIMRVALLMSGLILIINIGLGKPALDSLLFALALSLGLTPEMLPAIVTLTLSSGARRLAGKKVIVKKLSAIQDFGAMDILCADKTGTLTEGVVKVHACIDADGNESPLAYRYAYLNACYQSGYANPIDEAIRAMPEPDISLFQKFDEVPYDFIRKRLSVVVTEDGKHIMITKGAVKNILDVCSSCRTGSDTHNGDWKQKALQSLDAFSAKGFRTIGICSKDVTGDPLITKDDECDMVFLGFILLSDPPKEGIAEVLDKLKAQKVNLKIITGDNTLIARTIAARIGIPAEHIISGSELHALSDEALARKVQVMHVFAETEPSQKERIVRALQRKGHVVGYLGDGINDASALKAADVGISVQNAVDVAKESADLILLEQNLHVILDGIEEGRKTYQNTLKYIFITISANFGNMFSMAGASVFLPFLPLLPAQVLLSNFSTDLPALAISSDEVDRELLAKPRKWDNRVIRNFMIVFGLESSIFDYLSFGVLVFLFHASEQVFQTGWFIESVITEVCILLIIRTRRSFFRSRISRTLFWTSLSVVVLVLVLPYLPFAPVLGFTPLPAPVALAMVGIAFAYALVSEMTKRWFFKRMHY
ncbi:MAG: magnesium-translocating P-type ATPase, partial [Saprospiraceae bacterium]